MADSTTPDQSSSYNFLPNFYQTPANKKFTQATIDQLVQPGAVQKLSGYIGRQTAKSTSKNDVYISSVTNQRENYQLEPSITVKDSLGNVTFFKDYIDYINQINTFGGNVSNHSRVNKQEFYSWDPHIDWDKFVNFQNYYWLPNGPDVITISGQQEAIVSTYQVNLDPNASGYDFVFTPDGLTPNPTLKLYRGQTYKFVINSPGNPFSIKTLRTPGGSNRYSTPEFDQYAVENGTVTITIPYNSPDILYYVSETNIDFGGVFQIFSITDNTFLDVGADIIGKKTYQMSNGYQLSNGMKVQFTGNVTPSNYASGQYFVEGVGSSIQLIKVSDLDLISKYTISESVLFDSDKFDSLPFSDASALATLTDYHVINRASADLNPWTRYNRWFHKDVINTSATLNGNVASLDQSTRAKRPIIEFEAGLRLYNFGTQAIPDVDLIDNFTTDVFSTIEGSVGYNIDGVAVTAGQRILFTADSDPLVKNNIYRVELLDVKHISINGIESYQFHLVLDSTPAVDNVVLVKNGNINQGQSYWFDGTSWNVTQQKLTTNQPPLFDIVDNNGISFGNKETYPGSTFIGTKIFSYKQGTGTVDPYLGFALSYMNISNIGDIVFNSNIVIDTFQYKIESTIYNIKINSGYLINYSPLTKETSYVNGWQTSNAVYTQAAIKVYKNSNLVNNFDIDIFDDITQLDDLIVRVYVNGIRLDKSQWTLVSGAVYKNLVLNNDLNSTDVLSIRAFSAQAINSNGYYEIPINLQNNSLNDSMGDFTLGEVIDHTNSIVDNLDGSLGITFAGSFPGDGNLRDLGNVSSYGTKFVQHSGPASLSVYHITNQSSNIIRSIEASKDEYGKFKRNFISAVKKLNTDITDIPGSVDAILQLLNQNKSKNGPYYFTDMVPYGGSVKRNLTVVDYRIKTYPLSAVFTLDVLSNKAVIVYQNGIQLVYGRDYTFETSSAGIVIDDSVALSNGDIITTVEYDSTDGSFVPATPTKLGIWPAYTPQMYLDTSLINPVMMIQGHDGSQVLAYGDFRDDLILELEKRIFNNIKVKYDPSIFNIYDIVPSYNRTTDYSLDEFNTALSPQFYKWTSLVDSDFTKPLNYDRNNPFTFNYIGHAAPDGRLTPGYWRGIYRWIYDTDRPNICPWEMLGLSIQPSWWVSLYGPAPYTSDNIPMWTDIANGLLKEPGMPVKTLSAFAKPFLLDHLPVDESGNLVSPLQSETAVGGIIQTYGGDFSFGDVSPVEAAWRRSSYYPFGMLVTFLLLQPSKVFGLLLDRSRIVRNKAGQIVNSTTNLRVTPPSILLPSVYSNTSRIQTAGIINYIVDYISSDILKSYNQYATDLSTLSVQLSYRVGAFTSKDQFNLILDSKSPLSTGSVFVPTEDYSIFLNSSSPVSKITYSALIITRFQDGFEVKGYSRTSPYFYYYNYNKSGPKITIGGISESFSIWSSNVQYLAGFIVKYGNTYFRVTTTHTSTDMFTPQYFQPLSDLPIIGGQSAFTRTQWDRSNPVIVPYGTKFSNIQETYDFIVGYGEYLKDQGFIFDNFNVNLQTVSNWETSAKEFLFWTTQNWAAGQQTWVDWTPGTSYLVNNIVQYDGDYYQANLAVPASNAFQDSYFTKLSGLSTIGNSVISLSPSANGVTFTSQYAVVDDITNPFNDYQLFKVDGTTLEPQIVDSYRKDNVITYTTKTNDGIYGATFYLIQKEQVLILNNSTIFNDIIYNPTSGYRQERIKVSGYTTLDWNGSIDSPGFIFDEAIINNWSAWTDYHLGDIVIYQQFYYAANEFISGSETFVPSQWNRLSTKPQQKIIPNWTNLATQFVDFYSTEVDSFDTAQQTMAQHLIGYQKRQYLDNIIQDDVSEFKFYQGMIREKGTQNVLNKLFDVLSADNVESLNFYEEWALRVGQYGSSNAFQEIEFILDESKFKINPQGIQLVTTVSNQIYSDFIIRQTPSDLYLKPLNYNNNPWPLVKNYKPYLRTPGFVNPSDVTATVKTKTDILSLNIDNFILGSYIWVGFVANSWEVYRLSPTTVDITSVAFDSKNKILVFTTAFDVTEFVVGDYIAIETVSFKGFYQVTVVLSNTFTIAAPLITSFTAPSVGTFIPLFKLTPQLSPSIDQLDSTIDPHRIEGELVWTSDSGNGYWATWQYNTVYTETQLAPITLVNNLKYGRAVASDAAGTTLAVSDTSGTISIYNKPVAGSKWIFIQKIDPEFVSINTVNISLNYNSSIAISPDATWLVLGSPLVSNVATKYAGVYNSSLSYTYNQIISYNNILYQAIKAVVPVNFDPVNYSKYWKLAATIPVDSTGSDSAGLMSGISQGVVFIYKRDLVTNTYLLDSSLTSPAPIANEQFGFSLAVSSDKLFVSAVGNSSGAGQVYQLDYTVKDTATVLYNPTGSSGTTLVLGGTFKAVVTSGSPVLQQVSSFTNLSIGSSIIGNGIPANTNILSINQSAGTITLSANATASSLVVSGDTIPTTMTYDGTTSPLEVGMTVSGIGFTKGQKIVSIVDTQTVLLDVEPDSTPFGKLTFQITGWKYHNSSTLGLYAGSLTAGSNFGASMSLSGDSGVLAISAPKAKQLYLFANQQDLLGNYTGTYALTQSAITSTDVLFADSISVSLSGTYVAVSSMYHNDVKNTALGQVVVYSLVNSTWQPYQTLANLNPKSVELFGTKVAFMGDKTLVVFSQNSDTSIKTPFSDGTLFDAGLTGFITPNLNTGRVDVYDQYNDYWIFGESLPNLNNATDGYGASIAVGSLEIFVGITNALNTGYNTGLVAEYSKLNGAYSWSIFRSESDRVDITKIKSAFLYNKTTNELIDYIDVVDPSQGKIPGPAEEELKYKTFYDPATYTYSDGTQSVNVDAGMAWTDTQLGRLWWDLRTAKFIESATNDNVYNNSTWNTLFPGASIDIYEWVTTKLTPTQWDAQADTVAGLALGISGKSLYGSAVYSSKQQYDKISKKFTTIYYFWVKNKTLIPNVTNRNLSANDVSNLISNPRGYGYSYLALTSSNSLSLVNVANKLQDTNIVLSVRYWTIDNITIPAHSQWKMISEDPGTTIPAFVEQKWVDSLCGKDNAGRLVPDPSLPPKLKYGIENRPRQSMFVNRFEALKEIIEKTNLILISEQIVGQTSLVSLETYDAEPDIILGLYDQVLDTDAELAFANIGNFKQAVLTPIIVDGKITGATVVTSGRGYINAPYVNVSGTGSGAVIQTILNTYGQVTGVTVVSSGSGYDLSTTMTIRSYCALVHSDSEAFNSWSIYSYSDGLWSRIQTQAYDTRNYWSYADWFATGYNQFTAADYVINTFVDLNSINSTIGEIVKILVDNSSGWVLLEKYADVNSIDWTQSYQVVGKQNGTIQFSSTLYKTIGTTYGYDGALYDGSVFDNFASVELRNILNALKNDIFVGTLAQNYLDLFFTSLRYAHSEQTYVDWIFKTSFVKAQHNVGTLGQPATYKNDNLADFESYVDEVKPYRTKIREYISNYTNLDNTESAISDFDLQPAYEQNSIIPVSANIIDETIVDKNSALTTYPWKFWNDNLSFVITNIVIVDGGELYETEPVVRFISKSGSGATARAFLSNGKVTRIVLLTPGSGYLKAPTIILDGGLGVGGTQAKAVAIIGGSPVRSTLVGMKFDRVSPTYYVTQLTVTETFTGNGSLVQFPLKWAPDIRIGKSSVLINGIEALRNSYKLVVITSTSLGYTTYSGSLIFNTAPGEYLTPVTISITYLKDWSTLNAADRIQFYYTPTSGEIGKDLAQLMTGVDYGGVIVDGIGFNIAQGWDNVPFYSDLWDSADPNYDDYIITVTSTPAPHSFPIVNVPFPDTWIPGDTLNVYYIALESQSYTSDGTTTEYLFDRYDTSLDVTVSINATTTGSNLQGSTVLQLVSVVGIKVGDAVSITQSNTLSDITVVKSINTNTHQITLNQILYNNIASASTIKFTRTLVKNIDYIVSLNFSQIILTNALPSGNIITISSVLEPVKIDALDFNGTSSATNPNAVMTSYVVTGNNDTVTIPNGFSINVGDQIVIRKTTSDGSIAPNANDYDTLIQGGDLAYTSATGLAAEDIIIAGDGFVTPTSSPATEEVVPGQLFDTLSIKVYDKPSAGSANIIADNYHANGINTDYALSQMPNSSTAIVVKVDGIIKQSGTDYTINYSKQVISFVTPPPANSLVSLLSFGFNGSNILDIDYFVGNGATLEFITNAEWLNSISYLVYVNGLPAVNTLFQTDYSYNSPNRVGIRFPTPPGDGAIINFVIVSGSQPTFSIMKTERLAIDGTSSTYNLVNTVGNKLPNESNMIVRVGQSILAGPNNSYFTIGSTNLHYNIDFNRLLPYTVSASQILVYADGNLLTFGTNYTVDLSGITITITTNVYDLYINKTLLVSILVGDQYTYTPPTLVSSGTITFSSVYSVGTLVEVTSFYDHDILDMQRTEITVAASTTFTPSTLAYYNWANITGGLITLDRPVINSRYVWITKNQTLLTPDVDYILTSNNESVKLTSPLNIGDVINLITFSSNVLVSGIAYMQFKDMLNRVHFKRLSQNKQTRLTKALHWNDTSITVDDASNFAVPNPTGNKPGIIEIRGERIEYFRIVGNVISQLRRGTLGTGAAASYPIGTFVQEIGPTETLPYTEAPITQQLVSNGTNLINLNFVPVKGQPDISRPDYDSTGIVSWFSNFGYTYLGNYSSNNSYDLNNVVVFQNAYYYCVTPVPVPSSRQSTVLYTPANSSYWTLYPTTIPVGYGQANNIEVFIGGYDDNTVWESNTTYLAGTIITQGAYTYTCLETHTSGATFFDAVTTVTVNSDGTTTTIATGIPSLTVWKFFVGNIRLKKQPYKVFNVNNAPNSPDGDVAFDADFSVDGTTPAIRLTTALPYGTRVTVIQRTGKAWDGDYGSNINVVHGNSSITTFLKSTPGIWYENDAKYANNLDIKATFDNTILGFDSTTKTFDQG
jgi:hypothetical protein